MESYDSEYAEAGGYGVRRRPDAAGAVAVDEPAYVPTYDTAAAVDDALTAVKARFDHADAPYDPDVLGLIRAAETMRDRPYGTRPAPDGHAHDHRRIEGLGQ